MKHHLKVLLVAAILSFLIGSWWSSLQQEKNIQALKDQSRLFYILSLGNIIPTSVRESFEKSEKVRLVITEVASSADFIDKASSGVGSFDLFLYSSFEAENLLQQKLFAPIKNELIPERESISVDFEGFPFDRENQFTLPISWCVNGFAHMENNNQNDLASLLTNSDKKPSIALIPSANEYLSTLSRVYPDLSEWIKEERMDLIESTLNATSSKLLSDPKKALEKLKSGKLQLLQMPHGRFALLKRKEENLKYWLPPDKASLVVTLASISKHSDSQERAARLLNYLLQKKVSTQLALNSGHGTVLRTLNDSSLPEMMKASYMRQFALNRIDIVSEHQGLSSSWQQAFQKVFPKIIN